MPEVPFFRCMGLFNRFSSRTPCCSLAAGDATGLAIMRGALWRDLPLQFARRDKVPEHWQKFGLRRPEGSKQARKATTVGGALVNYLYGVVASEMTIALLSAGLDPGIGVFHADRENRASLAYDAMEAIRPYAEAWLLFCLTECRFSKRDFHEDNDATIRITRPLTSYLAMTAPLWRRAAEMVAGWLAESFAGFAGLSGRCIDDDVIAAASIGALTTARKTSEPTGHRAQLSPTGMVILPKPLPDPLPNFPSPGRAYRWAAPSPTLPECRTETGICIWNVDVTQNFYPTVCYGGERWNIPQRTGGLQANDNAWLVATVTPNNTLTLLAYLSWVPSGQANEFAVVSTDTYGLTGNWSAVSGGLLGMGGCSQAQLTDADVLTQIEVSTCPGDTTASSPTCPPPALQPQTIASIGPTSPIGTLETSNLVPIGTPATTYLNSDLALSSLWSSTPCPAGATWSLNSKACICNTAGQVIINGQCETPVNACGGTGFLAAAPGQPCGQSCGRLACNGLNTLICRTSTNVCGGCSSIPIAPGEGSQPGEPCTCSNGMNSSLQCTTGANGQKGLSCACGS